MNTSKTTLYARKYLTLKRNETKRQNHHRDQFKAFLECPLTGVKISNALLKFIFLTKGHKIWMNDN